jgi:hypothetical protein
MKVSSRYGSDGFLPVWYRHSTNSGNFCKTFDSYATGQKIKVEPAWVKFQVSQTHWSYAQIIFLAGFASQGGLNRDATMELEDPLST